MPKVSDDHRLERRRQIADAALRCFTRKGFDATSMSDIIAESGLSAGAIYLHYKNKQDLVGAVVSEVVHERSLDLAEITTLDPLPHPTEVMRIFLRNVASKIGGVGILLQVWSIVEREPELGAVTVELLTELRRLYATYLTLWFTQHGLDDDAARRRADALAPVVVGMCQGYILQSALVPGFDGESYLAAVHEIDFA